MAMASAQLPLLLLLLPLLARAAALAEPRRLLQALAGLGRGPRSSAAAPPSRPPAPPLLWRMLLRSHPGGGGRDPCWVEELRVPGNTVRVLGDRGGWIPRSELENCLCLQKRLYFNLSAALDASEVLTLARLEVKFRQNLYGAASPSGPFELSLYQASHMALRGLAAHWYNRHLLVEQSFIHLHKSFFFDLTPLAKEWRVPARNLGLILEIESSEFCSSIDSFLEATLTAVSLAPGPCRGGRKRRSGGGYSAPLPAGNICKVRRLYISFADVGWQNWIIAPQGYMSNYCLGECPFPLTEELNSTNHAILQTIIHSLDPQGTPQPCCVPVLLSPISILYYDNDDNVVLRHYEDMVVDECGCR